MLDLVQGSLFKICYSEICSKSGFEVFSIYFCIILLLHGNSDNLEKMPVMKTSVFFLFHMEGITTDLTVLDSWSVRILPDFHWAIPRVHFLFVNQYS